MTSFQEHLAAIAERIRRLKAWEITPEILRPVYQVQEEIVTAVESFFFKFKVKPIQEFLLTAYVGFGFPRVFVEQLSIQDFPYPFLNKATTEVIILSDFFELFGGLSRAIYKFITLSDFYTSESDFKRAFLEAATISDYITTAVMRLIEAHEYISSSTYNGAWFGSQRYDFEMEAYLFEISKDVLESMDITDYITTISGKLLPIETLTLYVPPIIMDAMTQVKEEFILADLPANFFRPGDIIHTLDISDYFTLKSLYSLVKVEALNLTEYFDRIGFHPRNFVESLTFPSFLTGISTAMSVMEEILTNDFISFVSMRLRTFAESFTIAEEFTMALLRKISFTEYIMSSLYGQGRYDSQTYDHEMEAYNFEIDFERIEPLSLGEFPAVSRMVTLEFLETLDIKDVSG